MTKYITALIAFIISFTVSAQNYYNHDIEGWAAYSRGGKGGKIIRVTNLNASGSGSLAAALAVDEPRTVVFEVGGVINMGGKSLSLSKPYITIAGQTAPNPGITITNGAFYVNTHDVILQHLRFRTGASGHTTGWEPDALSTNGSYNTIIDHCSASWSVDENCSASGPRFEGNTPEEWRQYTSHTFTMSNNIIAEGLSNSTHSKGEHSKGTLIHDNATEIAIIKNLYASNKDRNPLFKGGARGVIVNNYIYNPGSNAISFGLVDEEWGDHPHETGMMTIIGNHLQYGPSTGSIPLCKINNGPCEVYLSDNIALNRSGSNVQQYKGDETKIVSYKPVWSAGINQIRSSKVKNYVIRNAGARPWDRDTVDKRIIREVLEGKGKIINSENEVGGYPVINQTNQKFVEQEWNLEQMIKIDSELDISSIPGKVIVDSLFTIEINTTNNKYNLYSLDLLINGVSQGKIYNAPYKWDVRINIAGSYEVLLVAETDSCEKYCSETKELYANNFVSGTNKPTIENDKSKLHFSNPVREEAIMTFFADKTDYARLKIYDSAGRKIETLFNNQVQEGIVTVKWQTNNIPNGIYLYSLSIGTKNYHGKLILMN
jgi:hypothetical protein